MEELLLSIDDSCRENWDKMNENEQGRFCSNCCKTVVDFTSFSDAQLMRYFAKKAGQESTLCGKMNEDQLNRRLTSHSVPRSNPGLYKIMLSLFLLTASQQMYAQEIKTEQGVPAHQPNSCNDPVETPPQSFVPVNNPLTDEIFKRPKFRMGGIRTLYGNNSPLLIVDGLKMELGILNSIAPEKIKKQTILKGTTAAAIFGPDAANGVLMITTSYTKKEWKQILKERDKRK